MTELLKIGETRRIGGNRPTPITDRDTLYTAFVTDVSQPDEPRHGEAVDSFRLLHSLLHRIHHLSQPGKFESPVGEELALVGEISGGVCKAQITNMVSYVDLPLPRFQWLLISLVGELARSIRDAGVDIESYIKRFPPDLDLRKSWGDFLNSPPPG